MNTLKFNALTIATMAAILATSPVKAQTPAAPDADLPIAKLLATADKTKGEAVAKKCISCHTFEKGGAKKVGPNLYEIVDRPIASVADFKYSAGMQAVKNGKWNYETLYTYLKKPQEFAKGTTMSFAGVPKAEDRADLIAYLRSLSDKPAALPK